MDLYKEQKKYLNIAKSITKLSKMDKKIATLLTSNDRIIAAGVNGFLPKMNDADLTNESIKVIHSEVNAIKNLGKNTADTAYIYGLFPCVECIKLLILWGIQTIYFTIDKNIPKTTIQKYQENFLWAKTNFNISITEIFL